MQRLLQKQNNYPPIRGFIYAILVTMNHLLFFTGQDCSHCELMRGLIERLDHEFGISVEEKEVWKNEANYRLLEGYIKDHDCPGIPVFVNTQTGVILCGEISYKQLMSWAQGGNVIQ